MTEQKTEQKHENLAQPQARVAQQSEQAHSKGETKEVKKEKPAVKVKEQAAPKSKIIQTSGKRKFAIARATLRAGKGRITINNRLLDAYTPELSKQRIMEPLMLAEGVANTVDIDVSVFGGGFQGQTEAARLAIGKALVEFDKKLKRTFLDYDRHLLVADIRRKESRKPNDSKARAARQTSYR